MTEGRSDLADICVEQKAITERAILVSDGTMEAWLPLSQIEYEKNIDGTITVTGPEWLLTERGLL